ncbi:MAG: class I SAM-dependent methyltransferase [Spirochaetia bacterium]|nr:class I SAM-dependent methyltransferase [Spirochaetia bacterium]
MNELKPYTAFSEVYDATMKNVPYAVWAEYIYNILSEFGVSSENRILEIACGTGSLYLILKNIYYNLYALDISLEMLKKLSQKGGKNLLAADMKKLPFGKNTFKAIISTHDSINYMLKKTNLDEHFCETSRVLEPKGYYIFDASTEYNVINNYHNKTFKEKHKDIVFNWKNFYDFSSNEIVSTLEFQKKKEKTAKNIKEVNYSALKMSDPVFEIHRQKIYHRDEIIDSAYKNGFYLLKNAADYVYKKNINKAQLLVYIMQKK